MKTTDKLLAYNTISSVSHVSLICIVYIESNTNNVITEFRVDNNMVDDNPLYEELEDYFKAKERYNILKNICINRYASIDANMI